MTNNNPTALKVFLDDVESTTARVVARAKVVAAERAAKAADEDLSSGVEQIQLVASDPSTIISFEIPDGPPPETLEITGEGSEDLDPVLVKEFLQKRWDIFEAFPKGLKKALAEKSLEKVNKVLGKMAVDEAEEVVEKLQEAGILSVRLFFSPFSLPSSRSLADARPPYAVRDPRHRRSNRSRSFDWQRDDQHPRPILQRVNAPSSRPDCFARRL